LFVNVTGEVKGAVVGLTVRHGGGDSLGHLDQLLRVKRIVAMQLRGVLRLCESQPCSVSTRSSATSESQFKIFPAVISPETDESGTHSSRPALLTSVASPIFSGARPDEDDVFGVNHPDHWLKGHQML
jgi:hypothetical protein